MDDKSTLLDPSLDKQLRGHRSGITALYYSPNEQQLASSSLDNSVLLWDLSGALRSYRFRGHDEAVMDVTFSPSGKLMASASRDKTVRIWVPTVTGSTGMFKAHSQTVRSVQFSPDGTKLITASDDKIVKIWSSSNYKFISSFVGHTNWVRCARMSTDGSIIASCSDDKTTRLWNAGTGELIHTYKDQKGHGLYVAWHPSGCYIAVGTSHGNIKLYDIRTQSLVQYYSIHNEAATQLAFHPSGSYILTASKDGKMKILDLLEGHPIFTLSGHTGSVNAVSFSPSGETFASAGEDKLVNLWRTNFTELANDIKENVGQTPSTTVPRTVSGSSKLTDTSATRTQGTRQWYLCYHSNMYPVANFVQLDDGQEPQICVEQNCGALPTIQELPAANSTLNTSSSLRDKTVVAGNHSSLFQRSFRSDSTSRGECDPGCPNNQSLRQQFSGGNSYTVRRESSPNSNPGSEHQSQNLGDTSQTPQGLNWGATSIKNQSTPKPDSDLESTNMSLRHTPRNCNRSTCSKLRNSTVNSPEHPSHNVGHSSHIPRSCVPKPSTYTIPSFIDKTEPEVNNDSYLFGLVRLTDNDVCYTSGTIEWVGRKRSYPVNSGFKTLNDFPGSDPMNKKVRRIDNSTLSQSLDKIRECDCADMLPTVNAIVDHLNALHEAVDLIDLRLNTVEDNIPKD